MSRVDPKGHTCHRREACIPTDCSRRLWLGLLSEGWVTLPWPRVKSTWESRSLHAETNHCLPHHMEQVVGRPPQRAFTLPTGILPCYLTSDSNDSPVLQVLSSDKSLTSERHRRRGKKLALSQFPDGNPPHPGGARLPPWLRITVIFTEEEIKNCLLDFVSRKRMSRDWNKFAINTPPKIDGPGSF